MGEPGISERALVGRRVDFDDGEILAKYTLPFVDPSWHVPFTVLDRMGGPPRVHEGTIQCRGDRVHASGKMPALRSVESIRIDHFADLVHFDPWWAFRGVSGVDRHWIEAIFGTNIAGRFVHEGRELKVHDLLFSEDLRKLTFLIAKDDRFHVVEFAPGAIDLRGLRLPPRSKPHTRMSAVAAKAL